MEQCVASMERDLTNEDCGSDLPSVNRLLKAQQGLEEEVDGHRDRIQVLLVHSWFHSHVSWCLNLKRDLQVFMFSSHRL